MKNLALLQGKPLIYYPIQAAKDASVFDQIIVNSESLLFKRIAERYDVAFYQRSSKLASNTAKSDDVVYDFAAHHRCDIIVWINPTSPLQTGEEIKKIVNYFLDEKLDSLITVKNEQVHCLYGKKPINFDTKQLFAQTQDLIPVQPFVYSVMMWRKEIFKKTFEKKGAAFFCGKVGYYPVEKLSTIIIKTAQDLRLANFILAAKKEGQHVDVQYDNIRQNNLKANGK